MEICRKSEICELHCDLAILTLFAKKIFGLQITMHDVLVVHVIQGQTKLLDNVSCLAFLKHTHALDLVKEIATSDQLHDDVITPLVFKKLKYACDMWVHSVLKNS